MKRSAHVLVVCILAEALLLSAQITIGPGPERGSLFGETIYYEELMDWSRDDLRGLDPQGDAADVAPGDGYYWSRDIIAAYARLERGYMFFRADLFDLTFGAENGNLDLYCLVDCGPGGTSTSYPDAVPGAPAVQWNLAVCVYDAAGNATLKAADGTDLGSSEYAGEYFRADLDGIEFGITTQALYAAGWDGNRTIVFEMITAKDFVQQRADTTGLLSTGVIDGRRALYAAILHANQSLNSSVRIGSHIHDENISGDLDTGFRRALETAELFNFTANYHLSGTLLAALNWAETDTSTSELQLQDGPAFLEYLKDFVDDNQLDGRPGALIGGVFAEHIMPYFEGECNAVTIDLFTDVMSNYFGQSPADTKVMHVPERVIRSTTTGYSPLDGRTFEEIEASGYSAIYLDEINHLHFWFYPQESPWAGFKAGESGIDFSIGEQAYQHKIHKINGLYCFMINDREDTSKFWVQDDGLRYDTRYTLLQKALDSDQARITVVFDDWEAYAGRSFTDYSGNDNYKLWNTTARWIANHPWIQTVSLRDTLQSALAEEAAWVIDHGYVTNKEPSTYEWLRHACKDHVNNSRQSYDNWYYGTSFNGGEEDFYSLVPKLIDATPLPSGLPHGDLNTSNSLLALAWHSVQAMPKGRLKKLARFSYAAMIYETAWHDEDMASYQGPGYKPPWPSDDTTYDAVSGWALRLQNHTRDVGVIAAAGHWVTNVLQAGFGTNTIAVARDLDWDGQDEYLIANNLLFACFERYGGRLIKAFAIDWCPDVQRFDAREIIGSPVSNPSEPTEAEREHTAGNFNRCSAFRDAGQVDSVYSVAAVENGFTFTADGLSKTITLSPGRAVLSAAYTAGEPVTVRSGLVANNLDLLMHGQAPLAIDSDDSAGYYGLVNTNAGGRIYVGWPAGITRVANPSNAGYRNRNLPLTEQVELTGTAPFVVWIGAERDDDGIPDSYELANGLNPSVSDDADARLAYLVTSGTLVPEPSGIIPWLTYWLWRWWNEK